MQDRTPEHTEHQKPQTLRQRRRRHPHLQTDLVTSSCTPFTFVCLCLYGLHDLILALELLLVLKAVRVPSFSGITYHDTTDNCLCLMTRGRQRSAQI